MNELIANLTKDGISISFVPAVHDSIEIRLSRGNEYCCHYVTRAEFVDTSSPTLAEIVLQELANKFEQGQR